MPVMLRDYQNKALASMKNGCILNGGVGSGKSRTSLAYYYNLYGGVVYYMNKDKNGNYTDGPYVHGSDIRVVRPEYIKMINPPDLYIITTARKRDEGEWDDEMLDFRLSPTIYSHKVVVDSWNNIEKYVDVKNAFFIFDEQRVVGYGAWVKSFLKIAKANRWILLSATPGDKWEDYIPVFIANGFIKNKTDFNRKYAVFNPYITNYPKIEKYINVGQLVKFRHAILVKMDFERTTVQHHEHIVTDYDHAKYDFVKKEHWDIFEKTPIENSTQYCQCLRRIVNSSPDRQVQLLEIINEHPTAIIFYNYDYELELLRNLFKDYPYSEWNGHKHQKILTGDRWVYLVQYTAGSEAWNCVTTDTMIFFSQNYSYKIMEQASGRIDRLNTPYTDLYYYHFRSDCDIENRIRQALRRKKKFNESDFAPKVFKVQKALDIKDYIEEHNPITNPLA